MRNSPGERFDRISSGEAYRPPTRALDPRNIKIQSGWNVRDMSSQETRQWIDSLKTAILTAGYDQTKPISVRYDVKTGVATLVDGHCRLTACKELREAGTDIWIPCVVTDGDEAELTAEAMAGNAGQPLTQWEIGAGCKRLLRFGWSAERIAAYICKSLRYVNEAISLSNVSLEAKAMLANGQVTAGAVLHAVKEHGAEEGVKTLKEAVAKQPRPKEPAQKTLPGASAKVVKPKPVARPKKPSEKEKIAKSAPSVLELADAMYRLILDEQPWSELELAAKAYGQARDLK